MIVAQVGSVMGSTVVVATSAAHVTVGRQFVFNAEQSRALGEVLIGAADALEGKPVVEGKPAQPRDSARPENGDVELPDVATGPTHTQATRDRR